MWDRARVLLDRAPLYVVMRPLAGGVAGLAVGGLYGALCGSLHAVLRGTPPLFLAWFLPAAGAGTAAGFIMGVCSTLDRAAWGSAVPAEPQRRRDGWPSTNGHIGPHHIPAWQRLRRLAAMPLARLLASDRGTPVA